MKISNRTFDFDHGTLLHELECTVCEGELAWDFQDDFGAAPSWTASCCGHDYSMVVKSVRVGMTRE